MAAPDAPLPPALGWQPRRFTSESKVWLLFTLNIFVLFLSLLKLVVWFSMSRSLSTWIMLWIRCTLPTTISSSPVTWTSITETGWAAPRPLQQERQLKSCVPSMDFLSMSRSLLVVITYWTWFSATFLIPLSPQRSMTLLAPLTMLQS